MKKDNRKIQIISHIIMIALTVICLFPLLLMLMGSLTDEAVLKVNGYSLFPEKFSLEAYQYLLTSAATVFRAYGVSILVTAVGTSINLIMTIMFAYTLSRPNLPGKSAMAFFLFFTMLFNGGLVSSYITWTEIFHVKDTLLGLIVPNLMLGSFYVIMVRTYFQGSIPEEIIEAARIDGAGEFKILCSVVLPLSKPIVASVGLMVGLSYWNDWTNGLYYLLRRTDLYSIQNLLNKMLSNADFLNTQSNAMANMAAGSVPSIGIRMAIAVMALLPVMVIYPFIQKYLVSGIVIGGVKG